MLLAQSFSPVSKNSASSILSLSLFLLPSFSLSLYLLCSFLFTYVKAKLQGAGVHRRRGRRTGLRLLPIHCTGSLSHFASRTIAFDSFFFVFCRTRSLYARVSNRRSNKAHQFDSSANHARTLTLPLPSPVKSEQLSCKRARMQPGLTKRLCMFMWHKIFPWSPELSFDQAIERSFLALFCRTMRRMKTIAVGNKYGHFYNFRIPITTRFTYKNVTFTCFIINYLFFKDNL